MRERKTENMMPVPALPKEHTNSSEKKVVWLILMVAAMVSKRKAPNCCKAISELTSRRERGRSPVGQQKRRKAREGPLAGPPQHHC